MDIAFKNILQQDNQSLIKMEKMGISHATGNQGTYT